MTSFVSDTEQVAAATAANASSPSLAYHPDFASPNADVVLRTSDGVQFRTAFELLCRTSAWFRAMFTLPQASGTDRNEPIPVPESAKVLSDLLNIVNGTTLPALDDIDHIEALLAVADKYEMSMVISVIRLVLSSRNLDVSAIRLYGIACRMSWGKEAKEASSRTLTTNLFSAAAQTELAAMEPSHRNKLLDLHRRRRAEFFAALDDEAEFYANIRGSPCNLRTPGISCTAPLDHSHWWALKYALMKRWDEAPLDQGLDETVYRLLEMRDMFAANCFTCKRSIYGMPATIGKINAVIRALPRSVEVSVARVGAWLTSFLLTHRAPLVVQLPDSTA
ncbi:hypothetical protein BD413DRAFT_506859 [Trametes elegans]|nr:hypothetical protein BD413DRAFT_506859 [Trametes elegans]